MKRKEVDRKIKIGMMSPWNTNCGVSIHAELVGREWIKMGHDLTVFAPDESYWGKPLTHPDEPFVKRCYVLNRGFIGVPDERLEKFFKKNEILKFEGNAFVVQNLELMPIFGLRDIWDKINCNKRLLVIHEGSPPMFPEFYELEFDKIICFDKRYVDLFSKYFPRKKIRNIPYPCHKWKPGSKEQARRKLKKKLKLESNLDLPIDDKTKIVFTFGINVKTHMAVLRVLDQINNRKYRLLFLALPTEIPVDDALKRYLEERFKFLKVLPQQALSFEQLYEYLHAADLLILHKGRTGNIVVSSTVYLCLGSGCPIAIRESKFTEDLGKEVIIYRDHEELKQKIIELFEDDGTLLSELHKAIKRKIKKHDARKVAREFIKIMK